MIVQWIMPRARPTAADLPLGDNELRIIDLSQTRKDFPPKPASLPARPLKQLVSPIDGLKYPAQARRFEETGVTSVAVEVDADGNPQKCNLIRTSGFSTLDEAVCPHLMKHMHYEPTISISGQFIADVDIVSINWAFAK
ncbi:TonB family protein [Novosphingobium sp.]|uniref:TonB family protein n=1 Tax=Novosphingobium sp. TaxID=1874826 RepID=UPI002602C139|nr:TonB family protein [Novosphingobium sp.]